jgi:hypothetical protein
MTQHDRTERRRRDVPSKLRSGDIRSWCEEWDFHPDVRNWLFEAYAKGYDDRAIIALLNRGAAAQMTRWRNQQRMKRRRRIAWKPGHP